MFLNLFSLYLLEEIKNRFAIKKITFIILALISFQLLQAQQEKQALDEHPYIPLVVENAHWLQDAFYTVDDVFHESDTFDYKIEGDTIISGTVYKKVYWRYFYHTGIEGTHEAFGIGPDNLFGALRENIEEKKIYAIIFSDTEGYSYTRNPYSNYECALNEEILLYDFSLEIGEEIITDPDDCLYRGAVESLSNQYFFGEERLLQQYEYSSDEIYEGIGNVIWGLFENLVGSLSGYGVGFFSYCVGTDYECYADMSGYISVNELDKTQISITPNPATDYLFISNDNKRIKEVSIYDAMGRLLQKETQSFSRIDISKLNTNVLFIRVKIDTDIYVHKILKH